VGRVILALVPLQDLLTVMWIDLILVVGVITLSTLAAALVPSVRAALVDPAETLRAE